ncbi:MAG: hypothetical protein WBL45_04355 [Solirubrobacterales bacterium]
MKIALGKFASSGIETHLGPDIPAAVRTATFHYVAQLRSGRAPRAFPGFLPSLRPSEPGIEIEMTVDAETEALLDREALRQRTTASELVAHAVLAYLAELEFLGAPPRRGSSSRI